MDKCIINVSTKKYWKGQRRLKSTLQGNTDADLLFFKHEEQVGALSHHESMYGFKPMAFKKAYDLGYRKILWLDASMLVIKDLNPIFEAIEKDGYFFQDSGWMNDRWTTEKAKSYFGTDQGKMISSGVLGLNLDNPVASDFLYLWIGAMNDGLFNGSHETYRHDQSAASLIIEKMKLKITSNNMLWNYGRVPFHEDILILADGIC